MNVLSDSINATLKNLQDKRDFLVEQRYQYENIRRHHLSDFEKDRFDDDELQDDTNGLVFGDIIFASKKIYLNIGYEYYVEKSFKDVVEFVDDKLNMMENAIRQFDDKIAEANETLKNIKNLSEADDDSHADENGDSLPSVEIREELDENGNVIGSTVTPTSNQKLLQPHEQPNGLSTFEQNLVGKLTSGGEKVDTVRPLDGQQELSAYSPAPIDMANMYTFADLVKQMDEQDEQDEHDEHDEQLGQGGQVDSLDDVGYEDDDSDDDYYEPHFSLIPGMSAQQAFLNQINRLRHRKGSVSHSDERTENVQPNISNKEQVRSILKKSNQKSKKKPKSVGFAPELDIKEVVSLKEENKRNTQHFAVSSLSQPAVDTTNPGDAVLSESDFDSDLFAKLIGIQGPDEIHDKYKEQISKEEKKQESHQVEEKKTRVSRFKKERGGEAVLKNVKKEYSTPSSAMSQLVIERSADDIISNVSDVNDIKKDDISKESPPYGVFMESPSETSAETDAGTNDIVERSSGNIINDISKRNEAIPSEYMLERNSQQCASKNKEHRSGPSPFSKNLKSLAGPRKRLSVAPKVDLSVMNDLPSDEGEQDSVDMPHASSDDNSKFFSEQNFDEVNKSSLPYKTPTVDYHTLGENIDDMAKAYSLGIYEDDLEEDPGVIIERIEDFKEHNKQVDLLKDEIEAFRMPSTTAQEESNKQYPEDEALVTDIQENKMPENYNTNTSDQPHLTNVDEDLSLDYHRLNESIAIEYRRLREQINSRRSRVLDSAEDDSEGKQLEPIDEFGNPIKVSRFRSERLQVRDFQELE